jgi:hypothetical protein
MKVYPSQQVPAAEQVSQTGCKERGGTSNVDKGSCKSKRGGGPAADGIRQGIKDAVAGLVEG